MRFICQSQKIFKETDSLPTNRIQASLVFGNGSHPSRRTTGSYHRGITLAKAVRMFKDVGDTTLAFAYKETLA